LVCWEGRFPFRNIIKSNQSIAKKTVYLIIANALNSNIESSLNRSLLRLILHLICRALLGLLFCQYVSPCFFEVRPISPTKTASKEHQTSHQDKHHSPDEEIYQPVEG